MVHIRKQIVVAAKKKSSVERHTRGRPSKFGILINQETGLLVILRLNPSLVKLVTYAVVSALME